MRPATKLGLFGIVLAVALAVGMTIGATVGPIDVDGTGEPAPSGQEAH